MGSTYPSSLSLKNHIRIKTCEECQVDGTNMPLGMFLLFFEGVSQLGGANMPPRDVYYLFEGVGA